MAIFFKRIDRQVIPNFRSFEKTTELGELDSVVTKSKNLKHSPNVSDFKNDWDENRSIPYAADLLSAVFTNNIEPDLIIRDAADFILNNQEISTLSQIEIARRILGLNDSLNNKKSMKISQFIEKNNLLLTYNKIKEIKSSILKFNKNPIDYVELARLYSEIGEIEKAIQNLRIALFISPNNRYVIRSFVRLLFNREDFEQAHDILRKNERTLYDPWLMSAEIALATTRGRSSRFIKQGIEIISSNKYNPKNFTELASSIGTVELLNGNNKKSKQFFNSALKSPNDNSLAQAEWASEKNPNIIVNQSDYNVSYNYEALALDCFQKSNWAEAVKLAEDWFVDMPFSKSPALFGSHTAIAYLDDNKQAALFCKAGLITNPNDPQIMNNLAYSLANIGEIKEAEENIDKVLNNHAIGNTTKLCANATLGLINYKKGNLELGRKLYLKTIEEAIIIKNFEYQSLALINYVKEEILINNPLSESMIKMLKDNKFIDGRKDLAIQRERVEDLFISRKRNPFTFLT